MSMHDYVICFCEPSENEDQPTPRDCLNYLLIQLQSKKATYINLIEALGPVLTADEANKRSRGMCLLSESLIRLPDLILSSSDVHVILTFLTQRLKDMPCVSETIPGIHALMTHYELQQGECTRLLNLLFSFVSVQSLVQPIRYLVYEMLLICIRKYKEEVLLMDNIFVDGFTSVMDGEKDPRHLLMCFSIVEFILASLGSSIDIGSLEELYEVTSCYFPIKFKNPKNGPTQVSQEELCVQLRNCLSGDSRMTQWSLDLYLEHMKNRSESTPESMIDALLSISQCVRRFNVLDIGSHLSDLWCSLRDLILECEDEEVVAQALLTIRDIVSVLCSDYISGFINSSVVFHREKFIEPLLTDCRNAIQQPEMKLSRIYSNILSTAASASCHAYREILSFVWPPICTRFSQEDMSITSREALVIVLHDLIEASTKFSLPPNTDHPILIYLDTWMQIFWLWFGQSDHSLKIGVMKCWSLFGQIRLCEADESRSLLSHESTQKIIQVMSEVLTMDSIHGGEILQYQCIDTLVNVVRDEEQFMLEYLFPLLFSCLTQIDENKQEHSTTMITLLNAITALSCISNESLTLVMHNLLRFMVSCSSQSIRIRALSFILKIVQNTQSATLDIHYTARILEATTTFSCAFLLLATDKSQTEYGGEREVWTLCAEIARECMHSASVEFQKELLQALFQLFFHGQIKSLQTLYKNKFLTDPPIELDDTMMDDEVILPFSPNICNSKVYHMYMIELFSFVFTSLRREVNVPEPIQVAEVCLAFACSDNFDSNKSYKLIEHSKLCAIQCVASLANKLPVQLCDAFLKEVVFARLFPMVYSFKEPHHTRIQCVYAIVWVIKAMLMRNHSSVQELCVELCKLVIWDPDTIGIPQDLELSNAAAKGFKVITGDSELSLNRKTFANTGIHKIYVQKFYAMTMTTLMKAHNQHLEDKKENALYLSTASTNRNSVSTQPSSCSVSRVCSENSVLVYDAPTNDSVVLSAIVNLLQNLPRVALMKAIIDISILVVHGFTSSHLDLRLSCLETLHTFLIENLQCVEQHLDTVIICMLELAIYKPRISVRMTALNCLMLIAKLPYHRIYPFQKRVIYELDTACDDHKRKVRQLAMKARNKWHLISS